MKEERKENEKNSLFFNTFFNIQSYVLYIEVGTDSHIDVYLYKLIKILFFTNIHLYSYVNIHIHIDTYEHVSIANIYVDLFWNTHT